ncbi:MAG TPA: hypothetical protein PLQ45_00185 [Anaerohalosphaeraceae bacterium]|jgi:predicted metal-dependent hydrolase|nr:hypothetical protein [Anaerohalosphaeraceae bacterium]
MPRKRKKGEQELRILPDGRIVLVAPDQALLEAVQSLVADPSDPLLQRKRNRYDRKQTADNSAGRPEEGIRGRQTK